MFFKNANIACHTYLHTYTYLWFAETYTEHFVPVTGLISALVNCSEIVTRKLPGGNCSLAKKKAVVHTHFEMGAEAHQSPGRNNNTQTVNQELHDMCFCASICSQNSHPHA